MDSMFASLDSLARFAERMDVAMPSGVVPGSGQDGDQPFRPPVPGNGRPPRPDPDPEWDGAAEVARLIAAWMRGWSRFLMSRRRVPECGSAWPGSPRVVA